MSSILMASVPAHGHVTPMLAVARHLVQRGDDVRFLTGGTFADRVTATGATFVALPREAELDEEAVYRDPERAALGGAKAVAHDIEHVFAKPAPHQYDALETALGERPADVVLTDPGFVGGLVLLGHPRPARPPLVVCGIMPLATASRDTAPFGLGLPPTRWFNRARNAVLAIAQRRIMAGANRFGDEVYYKVHGAPMPCALLDWNGQADALVQFSVASFEYPRSDSPVPVHFVGAVNATGSQAALPDWWGDLDGTRPVVHVTQGTFANRDYAHAIAPTLEALADEHVLVVVATGGRPVATLPSLPANARAAEYLPYDDLLPRTAVYVTNGGYGGVHYALRYGVPIVATGGKEDKPEVGARVAWSGVGRRIRSERPSPTALRRAVLDVLDQPRYRQASEQIAADLAAAPGLAGMTAVIDRLVVNGSSVPSDS